MIDIIQIAHQSFLVSIPNDPQRQIHLDLEKINEKGNGRRTSKSAEKKDLTLPLRSNCLERKREKSQYSIDVIRHIEKISLTIDVIGCAKEMDQLSNETQGNETTTILTDVTMSSHQPASSDFRKKLCLNNEDENCCDDHFWN